MDNYLLSDTQFHLRFVAKLQGLKNIYKFNLLFYTERLVQ